MAPTGSAHPNIAMAIVSTLGGLMGYVRKGSKPSLAAGLLFGGIYGYSGYLVNSNEEVGHDIASVSSVVLAGIMGSRALKSRSFMPGGLVACCAVVVGSYNAYKSYGNRF